MKYLVNYDDTQLWSSNLTKHKSKRFKTLACAQCAIAS